MYIKVKFLKNGEPHGREYTYKATSSVRVGAGSSSSGRWQRDCDRNQCAGGRSGEF